MTATAARPVHANADARNNWDLWLFDNAKRGAHLVANAGTNEFCASLFAAIGKYGDLTEKQAAALDRMMSGAPAAEAAKPVTVAPLIAAFDSARLSGLKKPTVRFAEFTMKAAAVNSRNPGAIYVTTGETYLGKIADGRFFPVRECDAATADRVVSLCSDPLAAAIAHGRETGTCALCGRELTAEESMTYGIGPICRERYGL